MRVIGAVPRPRPARPLRLAARLCRHGGAPARRSSRSTAARSGRAHRNAANATMIDSDDVRLLRYARPTWSLATPAAPRRAAMPRRRRAAIDRVPCSTSAPCARRSTPRWRRGFERERAAAAAASAVRRPARCSRPSRRRTTTRACRCAAARTSSPGSRAMPTPRRQRAPASAWRARRAGTRSCCRACSRASAAPMQQLRLRPTVAVAAALSRVGLLKALGRGRDGRALDAVPLQRLGDEAAALGRFDEAGEIAGGVLGARGRQAHRLLDHHEAAGQEAQARQPGGIGLELLLDAGGDVGVLTARNSSTTFGEVGARSSCAAFSSRVRKRS